MICSQAGHIILLFGEAQKGVSSRSISLSSDWVGEIDVEITYTEGLSVLGLSDTSQGYNDTHQEQKDDSRKKKKQGNITMKEISRGKETNEGEYDGIARREG